MQLSFPHNQSTTTSPNFNTNYHNSYQYQPNQTYQLQPTVVNQMTRSRIIERNKYASNQPLYNPLRTAVNPNKQHYHSRQYQNMVAARNSTLTHEYRPISLQQIGDIRNNTYMIQQPLKPTDHIQKVQGKHYFILDSHEKQGTPINQIQFKSRLAASRQKNIVIYEAEDSPKKTPTINLKPASMADKNSNIPNNPEKYKSLSKYNLYSCLDEPFERVKNYGCKAFTCPANQCVAKSNKYDWHE